MFAIVINVLLLLPLRYTAAFKQAQQGAITQAKVDAARDEVEGASNRMEQTRVSDHIATTFQYFI